MSFKLHSQGLRIEGAKYTVEFGLKKGGKFESLIGLLPARGLLPVLEVFYLRESLIELNDLDHDESYSLMSHRSLQHKGEQGNSSNSFLLITHEYIYRSWPTSPIETQMKSAPSGLSRLTLLFHPLRQTDCYSTPTTRRRV
ncbi:hypothetical protein LguiB_018329 [Lonicera macranthoides]